MRDQKAVLHWGACLLILFAGFQCRLSGASEAAASEIDELRQQVDSQRKQIEMLQSALEKQQHELDKVMRIIGAHPDPVPAASEDDAAAWDQRLAKIETDVAAHAEANSEKIGRLSKLSFSGDIRVRYETSFQQGAANRNRERVRARFHMNGRLSEEFSGGLSLATGSLDEPISTNQTLTGFFNRKNLGIDKAWITYKPKYAPFLKLDAGKFASPWYHTALSFDRDLNPEGFAETLSFDLNAPVLKNITAVGFQLPFNETAVGQDSFILGGQIQTHFRIHSRARLALYGAGINVNRTDPIAIALANGTLRPSLPNTNTYRYDTSGTVVGYASKFAYLDAIVRLDLDTHPRFPAAFQFNFLNNVRGPRERSAYRADLIFGRLMESGDVQFSYSFIRIEKEAVIGAWNESDMRAPTNLRNHRLNAGFMFKGNFTAEFTAWIGKLANPWDNVDLVPSGVHGACSGAVVSGCEDPYLKRLQLDLTYHF